MAALDECSAKGYQRPMLRLAALLLTLSCITAQARVGETLSECETRYGPVVERRPAEQKKSDPEACVFSKNSITIIAEFSQGKVWKISYSQVGMDGDVLSALLNANAAGGSWSPPLRVSGQEVRSSSDRIAIFTPGKRPEATFTLIVATKDFATANRVTYEEKLVTVPALLKARGEGKGLKDF